MMYAFAAYVALVVLVSFVWAYYLSSDYSDDCFTNLNKDE
ncbi:hypothetical protein LEM8419_03585 [Neolewinella maritima]|uniref:Uncharacterized protein n=1 Tax=Neolewinella maritima TaxID=1383882 RepID=A0ABN8FBI1_9BACT|nr:hypothetical protein LEM8419_03585 [Neolewinella maritima]